MIDRHRPYFVSESAAAIIICRHAPESKSVEVVAFCDNQGEAYKWVDRLNTAHQVGVEVGASEATDQIASGHCPERFTIN